MKSSGCWACDTCLLGLEYGLRLSSGTHSRVDLGSNTSKERKHLNVMPEIQVIKAHPTPAASRVSL